VNYWVKVMKKVFLFQTAFINIYAARLWHDLHDSKVFFDYLRDKLTRKLLKTKVRQNIGTKYIKKFTLCC